MLNSYLSSMFLLGRIRIDTCPVASDSATRSHNSDGRPSAPPVGHPANGTCISNDELTAGGHDARAAVVCCRSWMSHDTDLLLEHTDRRPSSGVECATHFERDHDLLDYGPRSPEEGSAVELESIFYWWRGRRRRRHDHGEEDDQCFPESSTYSEALSFCEALVTGGHDDWRLCRVEEIQEGVCCDREDPSLLGVSDKSHDSASTVPVSDTRKGTQSYERTFSSLLSHKALKGSVGGAPHRPVPVLASSNGIGTGSSHDNRVVLGSHRSDSESDSESDSDSRTSDSDSRWDSSSTSDTDSEEDVEVCCRVMCIVCVTRSTIS